MDNANSYLKVHSHVASECYLNSLKEHDINEEDVGLGGSNSSTRYEVDGKIYSVADPLDSIFLTARDRDRYESPYFRVASLIAIARNVKHGDAVKVVVGLPSNHYKNEDIEKTIDHVLCGVQRVKIGDEMKEFEIKETKSVLQPVASLYPLIISDNGHFTTIGEDIAAKRKKVIIDIGFGTTDVAILDGMKLIEWFTIDISMMDAYKEIQKNLKLVNKVEPLAIEQGLKESSAIEYGGVTYDATKAKEDAFQRIADRIISRLKNKISLESVDLSLFTGGGVDALYTPLRKHLEGVPNAIKVKNAQKAIAHGLWLNGMYGK